MKSGQFNSRKSQIRGTREKEAPKSTNWDRVIYLTLLTVALLAIVYFTGKANLFIRGDGRIVTNQVELRAPSDIRIQDIFVELGDSVQKSDTLFQFTFLEWNQSADSLDDLKERLLKYQEELDDVTNDLRIKEIEAERVRSRLDHFQNRTDRLQSEVKLGFASVNQLNDLQDQIVYLEGDLKLVNEELSVLRNRRNRLQQSISSPYSSQDSEALRQLKRMKMVYTSPVNGTVTALHKASSELGLKSERVMTILGETSDLKIQAIFEQDAGKNMSIGDVMDIAFDNGESSKGVITDIYAAESVVDRPNSSSNTDALKFSIQLIVELKPVNEQERQTWKANNKMGITATKSIF